MYIYTLYYSYPAIVLQKLRAWTSVEIWLSLCNGSIASVYNAKSSDISSQVCYSTRDLLRRPDQ